jgi:hypothetical protein
LDVEIGRDGGEAHPRSEAVHHRFTNGADGDEDSARGAARLIIDHAVGGLSGVPTLQAKELSRPTLLLFRLATLFEKLRKLAALDQVRALVRENRQPPFDPVPDRIAVNLEESGDFVDLRNFLWRAIASSYSTKV